MINPCAALLRKLIEQLCDRGRVCTRDNLEVVRFGADGEEQATESVTVAILLGATQWRITATSPAEAPPLGRLDARSLTATIVGPLQDHTWAEVIGAMRCKAA